MLERCEGGRLLGMRPSELREMVMGPDDVNVEPTVVNNAPPTISTDWLAKGEVGTVLADEFGAAQLDALDSTDRSNKIGRTAVQVGIPASLVTIGVWWARLRGIDLDPGPGVELPPDVTAAFVAVTGTLIAWRMNRKTN